MTERVFGLAVCRSLEESTGYSLGTKKVLDKIASLAGTGAKRHLRGLPMCSAAVDEIADWLASDVDTIDYHLNTARTCPVYLEPNERGVHEVVDMIKTASTSENVECGADGSWFVTRRKKRVAVLPAEPERRQYDAEGYLVVAGRRVGLVLVTVRAATGLARGDEDAARALDGLTAEEREKIGRGAWRTIAWPPIPMVQNPSPLSWHPSRQTRETLAIDWRDPREGPGGSEDMTGKSAGGMTGKSAGGMTGKSAGGMTGKSAGLLRSHSDRDSDRLARSSSAPPCGGEEDHSPKRTTRGQRQSQRQTKADRDAARVAKKAQEIAEAETTVLELAMLLAGEGERGAARGVKVAWEGTRPERRADWRKVVAVIATRPVPSIVHGFTKYLDRPVSSDSVPVFHPPAWVEEAVLSHAHGAAHDVDRVATWLRACGFGDAYIAEQLELGKRERQLPRGGR